MIASIELKYQAGPQAENVGYHLRSFDVNTLLGDNSHLPAPVRGHITLSLATFLQDTSKLV